MIVFLYLLIACPLFSDFMAQELFKAALYEDAAMLLEKQNDEDSHLTLAKCYFAMDRFEEVITLLANQERNHEGKHLLALAYQRTNQHEMAIALLKTLPSEEMQQYDLGVSYFFLKDYCHAEEIFTKMIDESKNKKLLKRANIYLVKMDLERALFDQAENKLKSLLTVQKDNPRLLYLEGDLYFRKKQYGKAISCFEKIIPKKNHHLASWYQDTLYQLGWSYLKVGKFDQAEAAFHKLSVESQEEKVFLSLAEALISKGKYLQDEAAYEKANHILKEETNFTSKQGKYQALIMKAEAALHYDEREKRYAELIEELPKGDSRLAESWYLRGMNDWNEGEFLKNKAQKTLAKKYFQKAADCLKVAYELYSQEPLKSAFALKFIAMSYLMQNDKENLREAVRYLTLGIQTGRFATLNDPLEMHYLRAIAEKEIQEPADLPKSCQELERGIAMHKKGAFLDKAMFLLGQMYHQGKQYENAEFAFLRIPLELPSSALCPHAYYGAALSAQAANKPDDIVKEYKQIAYERYPDSEIAAESYFNYYGYHEYLQGDRKSLKHLQALPQKFPNSPFSLSAYYLLGMDLKRDRKSLQGKWISKKNLTQSVEAFANVESLFDHLFHKQLIAEDDLDYYVNLRYRAVLERALANYTIAEESKGAKRQIYLDYAGEVFKKIILEFQNKHHPLAERVKEREPFPKVLEESYYYLTKIYRQSDNHELADKFYEEALASYHRVPITKSYFLAKLFIERGLCAFSAKDFSGALLYFKKAAEAGNGKILNSEETLDLLIQQSLCLQEINQVEEAMLLLSQVINCDVASSLRLKAMFLRANMYERLGKPHLAKRQLETIVAKGGDWAQKAQEKLEKDYGFY